MIKNLVLNYKIGCSVKKRQSDIRSTISYDEAKRIGIVFTSEEQSKSAKIEAFASDLRADQKKVEILTFKNSNKEGSADELESHDVSKKDLTISGKWKTEEINHFISSPFDYLLHLDLERNKYIDYIFAQSKAICRIGAYLDENEHHYDFILSIEKQDNQLKEYIGELKKYLKIIGSNEH